MWKPNNKRGRCGVQKCVCSRVCTRQGLNMNIFCNKTSKLDVPLTTPLQLLVNFVSQIRSFDVQTYNLKLVKPSPKVVPTALTTCPANAALSWASQRPLLGSFRRSLNSFARGRQHSIHSPCGGAKYCDRRVCFACLKNNTYNFNQIFCV